MIGNYMLKVAGDLCVLLFMGFANPIAQNAFSILYGRYYFLFYGLIDISCELIFKQFRQVKIEFMRNFSPEVKIWECTTMGLYEIKI